MIIQKRLLVLFAAAILATIAPAWSFDSALSGLQERDVAKTSLALSTPDRCLSLRTPVSVGATALSARTATEAAALSLVLGVHYATGPREVGRSHLLQSQMQSHAEAVAAYRACRARQLIETLSD